MTSPSTLIHLTAAVAAAAVGGLFYAFSTFVMRGLDRTDAATSIAAMRGINTEAQANAPFLLLFVGSALLALGVGITAALTLRTPGSGYILAGALLTVLAFVVTVAFNVPLNDTLDAVDPSVLSAADAAARWEAYLSPWTAWNHVRAAAPLLGSVLILIGLAHR